MSPTIAALDLRISIAETEPEIWREVRVPETIPLPHLHHVIQRAFGWMNSHLHMFVATGSADDRRLLAGDENTARELDIESADGSTLQDVAAAGNLTYDYDFGDGWEHRITVVGRSTVGQQEYLCLDGANRGPIEDSGGPGGYAEKCRILSDPDHPGHEDIAGWFEWVTGEDVSTFDPAAFDRDDVNHMLERLALRFQAPTPQEVADVVRPVRWLLNRVGDDGLELTSAGFLKPAVVAETMAALKWQHRWYGKFNRESQTIPVLDLRTQMQDWKLLRKSRGKLVRTPAGRKLHDDDLRLWQHLAANIALADGGAQAVANERLVTWLVEEHMPAWELRGELIAESLMVRGYRMPDGAQIPAETGADLFREVWRQLDTLGIVERGRRIGAPTRATSAGLKFLVEVQKHQ